MKGLIRMNVFKKFITLLSFAAVASAFSASTVNASLWSYKKEEMSMIAEL